MSSQSCDEQEQVCGGGPVAAPRSALPALPGAGEPLPTIADAYRSPPRRVGWLRRRLPGLVFYLRFFGIVWKASRLARRGLYGGAEWARSSAVIREELEACGVRFEVDGLHHLENVAGPCVIAANHLSTLETCILPGIIEPLKEVTFVVKQSLVDYPIFKHVMRSRDPIAVTTTNARADLQAMLHGGQERLQRGVSLVVFPEGSRRRTFDPAEFNTIAEKLALRAGVPIVPLALDTRAWGIGSWISDVGRIDPSRTVRFAFGPPIPPARRGETAGRPLLDFIARKLAEWESLSR